MYYLLAVALLGLFWKLGYLSAILALAFLIVVHEGGHYFVARWFGMRVDRFSIGFGPGIFKKTDKTFEALSQSGFVLPAGLMKDELTGSNVARDKFYDQIAFYKKVSGIEESAAGIFDFYEHVFRESDAERFIAKGKLADKSKFKDWRTFQMSDHLVMWAEFLVDNADAYLEDLTRT